MCYLIVDLKWIYLINVDVGHLYMYVFAKCMSCLSKYLFKCLIYFSFNFRNSFKHGRHLNLHIINENIHSNLSQSWGKTTQSLYTSKFWRCREGSSSLFSWWCASHPWSLKILPGCTHSMQMMSVCRGHILTSSLSTSDSSSVTFWSVSGFFVDSFFLFSSL